MALNVSSDRSENCRDRLIPSGRQGEVAIRDQRITLSRAVGVFLQYVTDKGRARGACHIIAGVEDYGAERAPHCVSPEDQIKIAHRPRDKPAEDRPVS